MANEKYYTFSNVLGNFAFDSSFDIIEKPKSAKAIDAAAELMALRRVLAHFKQSKYYRQFREKNLQLTKQSLRESVGRDLLAIQTIDSISELDRVINILAKRLREWYELYNPEISRTTVNNEKFVSIIESAERQKESAGADLPGRDVEQMKELALALKRLYESRKSNEDYLKSLMDSMCPNLGAVAGTLIGAKLISYAGSLKHLSELPASTIQILGAEKALFRHMRTGAKPPKYGILYQHQMIQKAKKQGRAARLLADKISIATKVDYFKGQFVGDKLLEEIKRKLQ
jgi:nucleolar protein 56